MEREELKNNGINLYVELDSLVDTRLTTLDALSPGLSDKMIKSEYYYKRLLDQFDYISADAFRYVYNKRDKRVLRNPLPTKVIELMHEIIVKSRGEDIRTGGSGENIVYINYYPYKLIPEEIKVFTEALVKMITTPVTVELINEPSPDPVWLNDNVGTMIMYDPMSWVDINLFNKKLLETPIPDVTLFGPMIVHNRLSKDNPKLFEDISIGFSTAINLIFQPVEVFNTAIK